MRQIAEAKRYSLMPDDAFHHSHNRLPESSAITIRCYENEIPAFVGSEIKRLYRNHFTTVEHLGLDGRLENANTYVVRNGQEIITIFLFQKNDRRIKVLNEVISVPAEEIQRFSAYAFSSYGSVNVISFSAIHTEFQRFPFTYQKLNRLEDIVASLPAGADAYTASLGKKTRSNLRRYQKLVRQDFPSFEFKVLEGRQIDPAQVRAVMSLYAKRMASKKRVLVTSETEIDRLIKGVIDNGLLGIATIDGRICAGAITCRVGANSFLRVLAHDPDYNKYSVGTLCCYLTIVECIGRGAEEFHFLWGESDYKYLLGGVRRDLDRVVVYRSPAQVLLNSDIAFNGWRMHLKRKAERWVQQARKREGLAARLAVRAVDFMRNLTRSKVLSFIGASLWSIFCDPLNRWQDEPLIQFVIIG